ncbi:MULTISPECIES: hypothetical protein [unclassified Microcoleus]|nr:MULTISPECIES: hypothetical protein [unclassified Microcoleus]MCC3466101.1 hypothetical protein [Microcoleus sp. PH2017_06_SFM_O_A]MCC3413734.1 hypothetical protein [Microcoleus sp. PH2017_02_FOX_O_A]MCC3516861.1 hypothetical protein [Microcoleus sp. PH2017_18_LLB_O_A]MCC3535730.1 hypothetical protein [Microcoleus sp. PH2017_25_DOB_D_A]MCC3547810.1 hypothetical protein [Microcoleus sp. PH2017_24_DOB_U_A]
MKILSHSLNCQLFTKSPNQAIVLRPCAIERLYLFYPFYVGKALDRGSE